MVVAAVGVGRELPLRVGRATQLAAADDERLVEQPALFEVADERREALVGLLGLAAQLLGQVTMVIPVLVVELHEPHAPLHEPAGEQAVAGERRRVGVDPVHLEHIPRLVADVDQLRHRRLHVERHLEGVDAGLDLGIEALARA